MYHIVDMALLLQQMKNVPGSKLEVGAEVLLSLLKQLSHHERHLKHAYRDRLWLPLRLFASQSQRLPQGGHVPTATLP